MARRSKGFSPGRPKQAKPIATRGGRSSVKVLSSEDSKYVGRPGFKLFGKSITATNAKAAVRRLMVRDPAVGRSNEAAAQHIHHNADPRMDLVQGDQSPEIRTSQVLPPSGFGSGRRAIKNRGVNRSIKKR